MDGDNTLDIQQNVGDIGGDFTKTIVVDSNVTETSGTGSDIEAGVEAIHTIFQYIPELLFVSVYGLLMYAAVLLITKTIKK
jgi:hypothetical protein|tara:strand:+ start:251 stop:493 length:243 start_codon:yes stop_codon:yes gene_type:complete